MAVQILLGFWSCASAQSLGTPSAEVLLGRPLDLSIPARFDAADTGNECVHADVFYGETRVRADRVRASLTGTDPNRRIRIETTSPVDEPVVTISVRAGCRNTVTRNYTLLPEYPSERMIAAAEARSVLAQASPAPSLRMAASPASAPRSVVRRASAAPGDAQAREASAAPTTRSAGAPLRKDPGARGPRLRLEPVETEEMQASLRTSTRLSEPTGDASQRATAALLWKAINADPQELLRTSAMLQKLEGDLAQMRLSSAQTRAELAALRQRIDQAPPWYASAAMVQGLLLLLLATGTAAGVMGWRGRRFLGSSPWYEVDRAAPPEAAAEPTFPADLDVVSEVEPQPLVRPRVPAPVSAPAAVLTGARPAEVRAQPGPIDFELPQPEMPRRSSDGALRVETLAATFEEVEFLSSLGLSVDAMEVLKAYLQDSASPAPLAFFELMRLCDQAGEAAAAATVRRRYAHVFGVDAPPLEQLTSPLGLDSAPDLSARITSAWGTQEALDLIEQALFKGPQPGQVLTVQAGRDLLCLYDLAMTILTEAAASQAEGGDGGAHPLAPWAHAENLQAADALTQSVAEARGGHEFGIDVDLSVPLPRSLPDNEPETDAMQLFAVLSADARRHAQAPAPAPAPTSDDEDAFSAVMASERLPMSRF